MKIILICALTLLLAERARAQPSAIARISIQAGDLGYSWSRYTETHLKTPVGYDSIVRVNSDSPDTSVAVWEFSPPRWMPEYEDEKYMLRSVDLDYPSFVAGFYTRHSLVSPTTFRRVDRYSPSPSEPYHLYKVSLEFVDSQSGEHVVKMDTSYDNDGHVKRIEIGSDVRGTEDKDFLRRWRSHTRSFSGKGGWLERTSITTRVTRLTQDNKGREILLEYEEPRISHRKVGRLPAGYRRSALDLGPRLDTTIVDDERDTTSYVEIQWSTQPSQESRKTLSSPFYVKDGRVISKAVRVRQPFLTRDEIRRDTLEIRFDALGRIVYEKDWRAMTYSYSPHSWLTEIKDDRGPNDLRLQQLELVRNQDSLIIARVFREAKKDEYRWDTNYVWHLLDHRYPAYERYSSLPIDRLSEVSITGSNISVRVRDEYKATISATLFDTRGAMITKTHQGSMEAMHLTSGEIFQILYRENNQPLYLQTVRLHGR